MAVGRWDFALTLASFSGAMLAGAKIPPNPFRSEVVNSQPRRITEAESNRGWVILETCLKKVAHG